LIDSDNRTFICSVVYYDIANYSTKSVEIQIKLKEQLNRFTTEAIQNVAVNDRIILDTGDGAAICFLGDPEDALFVAMSIRDAVLSNGDRFTDDPLRVRFGINLGAVKVVNDINNQKNIIGDGINVGQRIMSFAEPGQILVSRSYYEVVSRLTQGYAKLFHYLGTRADKHVREHEVYAVLRPSEQAEAESAAESFRQEATIPDRKRNASNNTRSASPNSLSAFARNSQKDIRDSASVSIKSRHWWQTKKFAYGGVAVAVFIAVILTFVMPRNFGSGDIQLDKTALSPEPALKNTDNSLPEITQSPENANTEKTESALPPPPVPDVVPQQESPDKSLMDKSLPEFTQSPENANTEKTEPALPPAPVPEINLQKESPAELPPENVLPKESAGSEQTAQPQTKPSVPDAIIQFAITPWGEVFVDGKRQGVSPPLSNLSITPGKHVIEIINSAFPPFSQTIEIESNEQLKFNHKFK
jgi:class 3 adenylate cyclase